MTLYKAKIREDIPANYLSISDVEKYRGREVCLKLCSYGYKYIGRLPSHNTRDYGWNEDCFEYVQELT